MRAARTILSRLRDYSTYLDNYPQNQHSIYFEDLVSEAFAHVLFLPYYNHNNDDTSVSHRVTWNGSFAPLRAAPRGADAIACCYGFYLSIEPTMKNGANQMTQEFAPALRHCENYCDRHSLSPNEIFSILICPSIFIDTYVSIKNNYPNKFNVVPITISGLEKILQTTILAFTVRHVEIKSLFNKISDHLINSTSLDNYTDRVEIQIKNWQTEVLQMEKNHFIAVKSYEAIKRVGGNVVGMSQIINLLQRHPFVGQYFKIIEEKITPDIVENSLKDMRLACCTRTYISNETFFEPVPYPDFESRNFRFIDHIKKIN